MNAAEKLSLLNEMNDHGYFKVWYDYLDEKRESIIESILYDTEVNEVKFTKADLLKMMVWFIDEFKKEPVTILAEVEWAISYEELTDLKNSLTSNKRLFNKIKEVLGIDDIQASE